MGLLQVQLAELRTLMEGVKETLDQIKKDLKEGDTIMDKHNLRIDRLEQKDKTRSKLLWTAGTAWIGLAIAWVWERLAGR